MLTMVPTEKKWADDVTKFSKYHKPTTLIYWVKHASIMVLWKRQFNFKKKGEGLLIIWTKNFGTILKK